MDEHGWVVGFGDLKKLEKYLLDMYDHTMIIAEDDPELSTFQELHKKWTMRFESSSRGKFRIKCKGSPKQSKRDFNRNDRR